jgi:hypothetical protein
MWLLPYSKRMPEHPSNPSTAAPLFSIIIPLEFHRGQWERGWQGWQSQTLDKAAFEIILGVPPDFPQRDKLVAIVGPAARLEYSQHSHDIALCAAGAAGARGTFLFFTEAHCWPEPDVLELCLQAFRDHPDWTGLSCKSVRVCHNRLSEVEADMYDADIEYGMTVHPWRKILDQCFVTRRETYEACGGLRPEFGHFSEWMLAANYSARGYKVGYLPEARVRHYYVGSLPELKAFTLDFVAGEIRHFSRGADEPGNALLEPPEEWTCRDNFEPGMARAILRMCARDIVGGRGMEAIGRAKRWLGPAIFGDGIAGAVSVAAVLRVRLAMTLALAGSSREQLGACFKDYIGALIRRQRLACIRAERRSLTQRGSDTNAVVLKQTGFYPLEQYQGSAFRWSETEAALRIRARPGRRSIRIECAPVRSLSERMDVRFFFDGRPIPAGSILTGTEDFEIQVDVSESGTGTLGWICQPFPATADPRRLGLPVRRVELISRGRPV